jgi:hypothetical protein
LRNKSTRRCKEETQRRKDKTKKSEAEEKRKKENEPAADIQRSKAGSETTGTFTHFRNRR